MEGGHSDVHVDSLAEAWYMGYMSYSAWANATVYLESGEVLTGQVNVCILIDVPNNPGTPSAGNHNGSPSSPAPSETPPVVYILGTCERNVNNINVPERIGSITIPASVLQRLNSAIPDHHDAMLVKGSTVIAKGLHPVSVQDAVEEAALHLTLKDLSPNLRKLFAPSLSSDDWDSYVEGTIRNASPMPSVDSTECTLSDVSESRYNTALAGVEDAIDRPPDYSLLYHHCQHWARDICK